MTDIGQGEGAISQGPMVVAFETLDDAEADRIVALLEANAILAVVDRDLDQTLFPRAPGGMRRILVPASMLKEAHAVSSSRPSSVAVLDDVLQDETDEEDEGPIEPMLPASGLVQPRLLWALLAISFGLSGQLLVTWIRPEGAIMALGARMPLLEAPWRLVTAGFMHGGVSHASSNGLFGVLMGVVLFGTHRIGATSAVWLVASTMGILAELVLSPAFVVIGASAGNYGLVGLWASGQWARSRHVLLTRRERLRTLGFLILLVPGALTPFSSTGQRIAVLAHAFGFLVGFGLGGWFKRRLLPEGWDPIDRRSFVAGWITVVIVATGFIWAMVT